MPGFRLHDIDYSGEVASNLQVPDVQHYRNMTGGTAEARAPGAKVSDAWTKFARHGDPNHGGLPKWPTFSAESCPVMIFDKTCEVKSDPDRELRQVVAAALG